MRYPAALDRVLGLGEIPSARLQHALARPGEVRAGEVALAVVHWSWFAAPHLVVAWAELRARAHGRRAALMAATFDVGLLAAWAIPTAPPWWVGRAGDGSPVRRLMAEAGERVWGRSWPFLLRSVEGNPWAAMPSTHFAAAVQGALLLSEAGRGRGALGAAYAAALAAALVHLGEHYVVDLAGGLALALGVRRLGGRLYFRK
jgi:hypothetical protein